METGAMMALPCGSHHILQIDKLPDFSFKLLLRAFMYSEYNNVWKGLCT